MKEEVLVLTIAVLVVTVVGGLYLVSKGRLVRFIERR